MTKSIKNSVKQPSHLDESTIVTGRQQHTYLTSFVLVRLETVEIHFT